MNNFSWQCPTKLILGKDTIDQVASEIKALGCSRVLMVYGSGSIKRNGIYDKTAKSLNDAGLYFKELSGVEPNPHYDLVLKGVELVKANDLDFILAVGGGSVIDTAKAISAGALVDSLDTFFEDCFLGGKPVTAVMKKGAILTIPAAGSEMSNSCVITNTKTGFKRGINTFLNYPQFAILDPTACYSLPAYQTACGCADILAHMQERYFSNTTDTYFSDLVLEASMKAIIELGPRCMENPTDYDLRAQIMFIGSMAHNNLLGACRTQDWASHWLEHELSTQYNVAHGAGLAIIFPAWMRYVHKANPRRFIDFFSNSMNLKREAGEDEEAFIERGIKALEAWYQSMGLPIRLTQIGAKDDRDFELMATRALSGNRTKAGNLMKLDHDDLVAIYRLAL